jgi:Carboxypeptidase regulatory-like domain/PASTA domain
MPLVKPALVPASAGQPITAQAWNVIQNAIGALYDAVLATGGNSANIELRDGSTPIVDAQVTAVPTTGQPVAAVPPRAGGTAFTLTGLAAGTWTVHVKAAGYQAASASLTVPAAAATTINLTASTVIMPNLLGTTVSAALASLTASAIQVDLLIDITGTEVSKTALPLSKAGARVLFQFPLPGTRVVAATVATRLVLSVDLAHLITKMPDLSGLTYKQAMEALEAAGLRLGNTTHLGQPRPRI